METPADLVSVSVLVPTRNEAGNIAPLVEQIFASCDAVNEVIFVDGASTDGTREEISSAARGYPVRLIDQPRDKPGLAGAIRAGAEQAIGEIIVVMDADLSHPPTRIPDLLGPLIAGKADIVLGSRYVSGGTTPGWPLWRRVLSRIGAAAAFPLTGVHDAMTGFFAIRQTRLLELSSRATGFKIAFETLVRGRGNLRAVEVAIAFRDRAHGESKMSLAVAMRFFASWLRAILFSGLAATNQGYARIPSLGKIKLRLTWFVVGAAAIVLGTTLLHERALVFRHAIDDEAVYTLVGNAIVDGGRPYIDAIERKPPLLFWTYAAAIKLSGEYHYRTLHVLALLWILATMAGLFVLGRRLFSNRTAGLAAAMLYAVFSCWGSFKSLAFNGEIMMNLPIVWAFVFVVKRGAVKAARDFFAAGALIALASLFKQPAAIAVLPLLVYCFAGRERVASALGRVTAFATGFVCVIGVVASILARQGILAEAFYWTVSAHAVHHIFWGHGLLITTGFVAGCLPLLLGSLAGLRPRAARWCDKRGELVALLAWLGVSAVGAAAGARFYPHYYLQLIPPLALLAAPWFVATTPNRVSGRLLLKYAWVGVVAIVFAVIDANGLAQNQPPALAQYVRAHSKPSDRIFVWGQDPSLYLEARRRPASRYILTFPLTGQQFGGALPGLDTTAWIVPGAWSRLESDFAEHPPMYVIDVTAQTHSDYTPDRFAILARLLNNNYGLVEETKNSVMLYRKAPAKSDNVRGGTN